MVETKSKIMEANELFNQNAYKEAEIIYKQVCEEAGFADVYHKLGLISHMKENFEQAINFFQKALDLNPNYYEVLMSLSITFNHIGKVDQGLEYFDKAMNVSKEFPKDMDMIQKYRLANEHQRIGDIYNEACIFDKAIIEYKLALELCPDFHDIRSKLGQAYISSDETKEASKEFLYIIEQNPKNINAINLLGLCYYKMNRIDQAKNQWERVQTVDPNDNFSKTYLILLHKSKAQNEE